MRDTKLILVFLGILVFLALGFVLHALKAILLPFVIAVFLGQIFIPPWRRCGDTGCPWGSRSSSS